MVSDQRFSLRWNNYQSQLVRALESLLDQEDLLDVTLGAEGRKLSAHKVLLSACSPYFRNLLKDNPCPHPIIILRDIKFDDLQNLLQFMYNGEVNVAQESLDSFLKSAESLKIRGLTDEEKSNRKCIQDYQELESRDVERLSHTHKKITKDVDGSNQAKTSHTEPINREILEISDANDDFEETPMPTHDIVPLHVNDHENVDDPDEMTGEVIDGAQGGCHDMSGQLRLLYPPSAIQQYFPCPRCGKVFTTPGSLRNHNKVHAGVTHCRICNKQFATVSSLNRHMKKEHTHF